MSRKTLRRRRRRLNVPGTPPGIMYVDPEAPPPVISVLGYLPDGKNGPEAVHREIKTPAELAPLLATTRMLWVNVVGFGDARLLTQLSELFRLHPLAMEDVVNGHQRAKVENYGEWQFIVCQIAEITDRLDSVQLSMFLGKQVLITFEERKTQCLDPIRERVRLRHGRLAEAGVDYLAYTVLDTVVDYYFPVIERYGDRLEELEDRILISASTKSMAEIHDVKRDLRSLRRHLWPLRDMLNSLVRDPIPQLTGETRVYLRDCHDHVMRIIEMLETQRELGSDLMDLQLSSISNRMNEIMKVLTVIATTFIPLTFISSIYGMNFDPNASPWNMPELKWYLGYPFALGMMGMTFLAMLGYFARKGWMSGS